MTAIALRRCGSWDGGHNISACAGTAAYDVTNSCGEQHPRIVLPPTGGQRSRESRGARECILSDGSKVLSAEESIRSLMFDRTVRQLVRSALSAHPTLFAVAKDGASWSACASGARSICIDRRHDGTKSGR